MKIHSFKIFLIILEVSKNFLHIYSPWMRQRQIFFLSISIRNTNRLMATINMRGKMFNRQRLRRYANIAQLSDASELHRYHAWVKAAH